MDTFKNPLEAVELIPIFSYLNILSDFLYIERYLAEADQNKPIPTVNGLYAYLQDNENNKEKKIRLIRNLLKGSDLYGAKENEYFDVTFVNVMFDYIITSLVFEKYGNIYGFLADIFLRVENLQFDRVMNVIITKLENEFFENEYGKKSRLSLLAVNRIYNDIILPLFPRPKSDLRILSLDYIYAQAGCMFLRAGRINNTYYTDFSNNEINATDENLFDQYLVTGHVIERLILTEEKNLEMLKAFALPALLNYVFNSKFFFGNGNMAKEVSNPNFWQSAYQHLFKNTANAFTEIEYVLQNDKRFKMHMALLSFQICNNQGQPARQEYFKSQIYDITEVYETYSFQLIQGALSQHLLEIFDLADINLLLQKNAEDVDFSTKSKYISYDFIEIYVRKLLIYKYYIINNENYNLTIISEDDMLEDSTNIRLHFLKLKISSLSINLKQSEDTIAVFYQNFANYKKSQLETRLKNLYNCQGGYKQVKFNWWEEFGVSLVPHSSCLIPTADTNYGKTCTLVGSHFFYNFSNYTSLKPINIHTQVLLSNLGTTIKSAILRNRISETVNEDLPNDKNTLFVIFYDSSGKNIYNDITLNVNKPAFQLSFTTNEEISQLKGIMTNLEQKTRFNFTSVTSSLSKISILLSNFYRSIDTVGVKRRFIYTLNNRSDTGYGYKFVFLSINMSEIGQFRTGYDLKDEKLLKIEYMNKKEKTYVVFNNMTFEPDTSPDTDHRMYEINNQLRRRPTKVLFSGLPIQIDDFDEHCEKIAFNKLKNDNHCRRRQRLSEKTTCEKQALEYLKEKTKLSDEYLRYALKNYTIYDNATLMIFIKNWQIDCCFKEPLETKYYVITNPDHLSKIRYNSHFDNIITNYDGAFRINSLYSKAERLKIEEEASLRSIIDSYNEQKARFSVSFHDYYAIKNYITTGYTRISADTNEAKLMKIALYNLAIRQSDDPDETFELKLFRVETKPISFLESTFRPNKLITLQKFTQAYPNVTSATRFSGYPLPGFVNILYEMIFYEPYPRAKVEQFYRETEKNVILLPGSEFRIEGNTTLSIGGLGKVLKLTLKYKPIFNEKYRWYQTIINRISQIEN